MSFPLVCPAYWRFAGLLCSKIVTAFAVIPEYGRLCLANGYAATSVYARTIFAFGVSAVVGVYNGFCTRVFLFGWVYNLAGFP